MGVFALMIMLLSICSVGCGDGTLEDDPTDTLPNNGSIDEGQCKDACDKVGSCFVNADTAASSFVDSCRQSCDQSGYFDYEAIVCIETADCEDIFGCGFEY